MAGASDPAARGADRRAEGDHQRDLEHRTSLDRRPLGRRREGGVAGAGRAEVPRRADDVAGRPPAPVPAAATGRAVRRGAFALEPARTRSGPRFRRWAAPCSSSTARTPKDAIPHEMAALQGLLQAQAEVRRRQVSQQANGASSGGSGRQGQDLSALFDKELQRQQRTNYETRSQIEERPDQKNGDSALDRIRDLAKAPGGPEPASARSGECRPVGGGAEASAREADSRADGVARAGRRARPPARCEGPAERIIIRTSEREQGRQGQPNQSDRQAGAQRSPDRRSNLPDRPRGDARRHRADAIGGERSPPPGSQRRSGERGAGRRTTAPSRTADARRDT